jgi:CubicO group peptidase (beta-lactamase class C family)
VAVRPELDAGVVAAIEAMVRKQQAATGIPGLALAVGRAGAVCYAKGFGKADLEHDVAASATTRFRTASIAKAMTAVAVMQLVEQGKLALDQPIRSHVPAFPAKRWPVTIQHLLCHQGGVRHYARAGEERGTRRYRSLTATLELFADAPLRHQPGTRFTYTTYGYTLLGCAVESASKQRFADYLREHLFKPAAMVHTCVDDQALVIENRTRFYTRLTARDIARLPAALRQGVRPGQILNARLHDTSMKVPGGGLLSTAPDLVRFGLALLEGRLVGVSTRAAMWTRCKTADGETTGYGLGFANWDFAAGRCVGHTGGQAGTTCALVIHPDSGVVVAIMSNLQQAGALHRLAARIVAKVNG